MQFVKYCFVGVCAGGGGMWWCACMCVRVCVRRCVCVCVYLSANHLVVLLEFFVADFGSTRVFMR